MEKGKCCEYCVKQEKPECPVKNAEPWSRWKNFCSEFEENEKASMCDSEHIASVVRSNATDGWISVKDRLPEFEQYKFTPYELRSGKVLVYSETKGFHFAVLRRRLSDGGTERYPVEWKYKQNNFIIPDVTHWCIPEPPEV